VTDPALDRFSWAVLVDALDELRFRATSAETADVLDWPAEMPANARVVASARPDGRLLERFRRGQGGWIREVAAEEVRRDLF
jgi:hypothetical protein